MGKYIELDVAKKAFQNIDAGRVGGATLLSPEEFSEYLDEIPTADVVPVRHGYWLDGLEGSMLSICSLCGIASEDYSYHYCPHCGAEMEVKNNG